MTINDPVAFCAGLWDWACLDGCFGETKIAPTDIDGFVERNGKFLVIETKRPGAKVPYGQHLTFERLVNTGCFTVMVVWGTAGNPVKIELLAKTGETASKYKYDPADIEKFRQIVKRWYKWADKSPAA